MAKGAPLFRASSSPLSLDTTMTSEDDWTLPSGTSSNSRYAWGISTVPFRTIPSAPLSKARSVETRAFIFGRSKARKFSPLTVTSMGQFLVASSSMSPASAKRPSLDATPPSRRTRLPSALLALIERSFMSSPTSGTKMRAISRPASPRTLGWPSLPPSLKSAYRSPARSSMAGTSPASNSNCRNRRCSSPSSGAEAGSLSSCARGTSRRPSSPSSPISRSNVAASAFFPRLAFTSPP